MNRKKKLYPFADYKAPERNVQSEDEPDVIVTAQGFAPNYEKFEAFGMTPEEALIWCNMD